MLSKLPLFSLRSATPLVSALRHAGHWNKHWQAGPYPKTEAERIAAAKKYNLLPEEYEPYDDDGEGWGDYPKLPPISIINKDHWEPWTMIEDRRDFGEPVHILEFLLSEDRIEWPYTDPGIWKIPFWEQWLSLFAAMSVIPLIMYFGDKYGLDHWQPAMARHMPEPGKVHYVYPKKE